MNKSKQRLYGIDIARLTAMFMVVVLHNLGRGGVLDWTMDSIGDCIYLALENYAIVAVNVFALISGYLSAGKPPRARSIFSVWGTACFWSVATALAGFALGQIGKDELLVSPFPVSTGEYWYLNSYLLLQLLIPILNCAIKSLSASQLGIVAGSLLLASTLFESTGLNNGYSTMWLAVLWLVGAAIKLNKSTLDAHLKSRRLALTYSLLPLIVLIYEWNDVHVTQLDPYRWLSYSNPYVAVSSICLFILATRINVQSQKKKQVLKTASPLAFAVYVIDTSNWFFSIWLTSRFSWILNLHAFIGAPLIVFISALFFIAFLLLEFIRREAINRIGALTK